MNEVLFIVFIQSSCYDVNKLPLVNSVLKSYFVCVLPSCWPQILESSWKMLPFSTEKRFPSSIPWKVLENQIMSRSFGITVVQNYCAHDVKCCCCVWCQKHLTWHGKIYGNGSSRAVWINLNFFCIKLATLTLALQVKTTMLKIQCQTSFNNTPSSSI